MSTEADQRELELDRAGALVDLGRDDEACRLLTSLLGREPDFASAWQLLAIAKVSLGEDYAALGAANHAIALEPEDELTHIVRSGALQNLGRLDESIAAAREAVAAAPASWNTHQRLAEALVAANQFPDEALSAAERAVELEPDEAHVHWTLGAVFEMREDRAAAERCYRQALALDPESADAHAGLARGQLAAGRLGAFNAGNIAAAAAGFRDAIGADPRGGDTSAANIEMVIQGFLHVTSFLVSWAVGLSLLVMWVSGHSIWSRVVPPLLILFPLGYAAFFRASAPRELRRRMLSVAFRGSRGVVSYAQVISAVLLLAAAAGPSEQRRYFALPAFLAYAAALICKPVMRFVDQLDED